MVARVPIEKKKTKRFVIPASVLARAGSKPGSRAPENSPFRLPDYPPLVSKNIQATMAMDDNIQNANAWATNAWIGAFAYNSAISEGLAFPGYAFLSELAQRPEYRRFAEITAMEMTRKWIKIQSKGDKTSGEDKTDRINELTDEMDRLQVRDMFRTLSEHDSYFGRGHLYIDTGDTNNREELKTSIGNGRNELSRAKIGKGSIKRLATVEPVWCYPTSYDSADPLRTDWYNPTMWYAMGKEIHATRLLKFVGRVVPDLLKPSYSFGGLSMSQMAKPYVDNWLRARQSVADIMHAFSVFVLSTDLQESLMQGGDQLFARIELFNQLRDNRGLMVLNKDSEEFQNVAASLGSLDLLQAQAQEHLSSVSGIPVVKLLGIQPAGLNASSEGEIRTFYDWVHAFQEKMFRPHLTTVIDFIQLSLWGEIDDDLTFAFEELWSLDEASLANKRKTEVETDTALLDAAVISPEEIRQRIASDPTSPYASLDVDDLPDLKQEEEEGLEPKGSAEKLAAMGSGEEDDGEQGEENEPTDEDDNAEDAAFKEDEHPRKDDGKFSKGGGGGSAHKSALKDLADFSDKPKQEAKAEASKHSITKPGKVSYVEEFSQDDLDAAEEDEDNGPWYDNEFQDDDGNEIVYDVLYKKDGDALNAVIADIRLKSDEDGEEFKTLSKVQVYKLKKTIEKVEQGEVEDRAEGLTEEARWESLTPEQQASEVSAEEAKAEEAEQAHTNKINNSVDVALANGWKPTFNDYGGLNSKNIPAEVKGFASPKSMDMIMERLKEKNKLPQAADEASFSEGDHPRKSDGKFGSGGKSSGVTGKVTEHVKKAKEFLSDKSAQDVVKSVLKNHKVKHAAKEALVFGLNSLIAHGSQMHGSFQDSHVEDFVSNTVHNFSMVAQLSTIQAKEVMRAAVKSLIDLRKPKAKTVAQDEDDPVLELLEKVLRMLEDEKDENVEDSDEEIDLDDILDEIFEDISDDEEDVAEDAAAEFKEQEHPRAPDGKFGKGSGGSASSASSAYVELSKKVGISDAYQNKVKKAIKASTDPKEKVALSKLIAQSLKMKIAKLKKAGKTDEAKAFATKLTKLKKAIGNEEKSEEKKLVVKKKSTSKSKIPAVSPVKAIKESSLKKRSVNETIKVLHSAVKSPTPEQERAIKIYTSKDFSKINNFLRNGNPLRSDSVAAHIQNYLEKSSLPEDVILHRGVGISFAEELMKLPIGSEVLDKAFLSTTIDKQMSSAFGTTRLEILAKKGSKGSYIGHHSVYALAGFDNEEEVLFAAGSKLRIISKTENSIKMELV